MIILSGRDGVCNPVANVSCEATAFGTAANPFGLFKEEYAGGELTCPRITTAKNSARSQAPAYIYRP
ncbi:MAG: hypothetical protein ACOYMG_11785 [Candidatus Methylumidiphilus sp.]